MAFMGMGVNAVGGVMGTMQQPAQPTQPVQQPAQEPAPQPAQAEDPYAKLEKLKDLLDKGVISQEEFDAAKAKLLGL